MFAGARLSASLDPALTSDGESFRVLQQIYEPLVDLAPGSTSELVGVLAESWDWRAGRHGVRLHPPRGRDVPRRDAVQRRGGQINFDRMQNLDETDQASAYYYGAVIDGFGPDNLIASIEATDELTVTFTLREPSPTFLFGITLTPFSIVSPAILESTGADSRDEHAGHRHRPGRHRAIHHGGLHPGRQRHARPQRGLLG